MAEHMNDLRTRVLLLRRHILVTCLTRLGARIVGPLEALATNRESRHPRKHGNIPR